MYIGRKVRKGIITVIYFTSDTHFNHVSIIRLCGRPFETVEQMNETIVQNWNSTVTDSDEVYFLGDLMFKGTGAVANEIIRKLNGTKYLIKGNHDNFTEDKDFKKGYFKWIKDYYVLNYEKTKFVLFHFPIFEWDGYFRDSIHLYGHIHNCGNNAEKAQRFEALGKKAINVGVDVNGFRPISILEIMDKAADKTE
jgi:calcineurin-like phosphoesterase family protein